jgi:hypothetical protein
VILPFYKKPPIDAEVLSLSHCDSTDPEEVEYHRLYHLCVEQHLIPRRNKGFFVKGSPGGWRLRTFTEMRELLGIDNPQ